MADAVDEEALAETLSPARRRRLGAFFTPRHLVEQTLAMVAQHLPRHRQLAVVDPACGAGAFLAAAGTRWPRSTLVGVELAPEMAWLARERLGRRAHIIRGDALAAPTLTSLRAHVPAGALELWVGNPPWNGTSRVLANPFERARLEGLLAEGEAPARGQSLRDDFAFFLLVASAHLAERGVLALLTPASLLDSYLYAPLRRTLQSRLRLREVLELPAGAFRGTKVRGCLTVWTPGRASAVRHTASDGGTGRRFSPALPTMVLRPIDPLAAELHRRWSTQGMPWPSWVPVSLPGLKTRFDELLTDDDPALLLARLRGFAATRSLSRWARSHGFTPLLERKAQALKDTLPPDFAIDAKRLRPLHRVRGGRRVEVAWCYLDRRLIPRGDHRFQGEWDPHGCEHTLVFNVRELPLFAHLLDRPGCVTAYQHTRFAPLLVPRVVLNGGAQAARTASREQLADLVPNLSPQAARLAEPLQIFTALQRFVASAAVQAHWAPAFGATEVLPVPFSVLRGHPKRGATPPTDSSGLVR